MSGSLFVVTNRAFEKDRATGGYRLLDSINKKGAKELRVYEATPVDGGLSDWRIDQLADRPRLGHFHAAGVEPPRRRPSYRGSSLLAARLIARLTSANKNLVIFVHGYNNTVMDALRRAWRLAQRYEVEVLVFSWPANGGGDSFFEDLHGKASYLADKSDARSSTEALDRALSLLQDQLQEINGGVREQAEREASEAHPDDLAKRREMIVKLLRRRGCPFRVTLLAHSMGNYLLKKTLLTSDERLSADVIFDNVILKAADTNHADHARWVERLRVTRRVYILINQEDDALRLSAMKIGDQQKPRLGNTIASQDADGAAYIDATGYVGDRHSYFDEEDLGREQGQAPELAFFFKGALNGEIVEDGMPYKPATNAYQLTDSAG